MSVKVKPQRLSKWLVQLGYCESRREAEQFVFNHRIEVAGEPCDNPEWKVLPDEVRIEGEPMDAARLVIMLNKPAGYVCSHEDSGLRVYDLLPQRFRFRTPQLITIGRLDKDTTGLLLLTDDGMLAHKLTHPKHHVVKWYEVELERPLKGHEAEVFASGKLMLTGEDKPCLPARFRPVGENAGVLELYEGRFHQVKRMFTALDNQVVRLHRARQGGLELGSLAQGQWKTLSAEEEAALFHDIL